MKPDLSHLLLILLVVLQFFDTFYNLGVLQDFFTYSLRSFCLPVEIDIAVIVAVITVCAKKNGREYRFTWYIWWYNWHPVEANPSVLCFCHNSHDSNLIWNSFGIILEKGLLE